MAYKRLNFNANENFMLQSDEDDVNEESESGEEQKAVKIRKVEKPTGRRSKRAQEESEDSEEEVLVKKTNRRSSNKPSRKNTPELEEESRPSRRSLKKPAEESPSDRRRASKRSLDAFNASSLSTLIDEIIRHPHSWPFVKPVTASEVPDYFEVIKKPMDFGKIKSKLNLGDYRTNEQVMKEIELVFYNCDLYNVSVSEIYK